MLRRCELLMMPRSSTSQGTLRCGWHGLGLQGLVAAGAGIPQGVLDDEARRDYLIGRARN